MGMSVMSDVTLVPQKSDIWWVFLLQSFAGIIIGLMLITEPGATLVALTTVLGFYWLITGVLALVQVFVDRASAWIWSLLAFLVGILAGLFVLRHPLVAALTVPTVLSHYPRHSRIGHRRRADHWRVQGRRHRTVHSRRDQRFGRYSAARLAVGGSAFAVPLVSGRVSRLSPGRGIG